MHLHMIAVRVVFAYFYLLFIVRASGKRTVAQATPMDSVVALVVGDMIDDLLWAEVSAARFAVGTGALAVVHLLGCIGCCRREWLKVLVMGRPAVIVRHGEFQQASLRSERIASIDCGSLMRGLGLQDVREAETVCIELSGRPSLIQEEWARDAQRADWERRAEQGVSP
jgi:uncharacterized membrane protein YcaP (DUF421 family)